LDVGVDRIQGFPYFGEFNESRKERKGEKESERELTPPLLSFLPPSSLLLSSLSLFCM